MAWENCKETKYAMSLIDINSEPPIEEIITLPNLELDSNFKVKIWDDFESKQITSSVVPFFDKDLYTELYSHEPQKKRPIGIGNYF